MLDGQRLFERPAAASRSRSSFSPCRFGLSPEAFAALPPPAFAALLASTRALVFTLAIAAPSPSVVFTDTSGLPPPALERLPCDGPAMAASIVPGRTAGQRRQRAR